MISLEDPLRAAIDKHLRSLITPRDDWQHAHISDLFGCDYQTHARRSSSTAPVEDRDAAGALRMDIGNAYEDRIAAGILTLYPESAERGERIAWNPYTMKTRRGMLDPGHPEGQSGRIPCDGCEDCAPLENELIGHLDVFVEEINTVFEIKSTSHFAFKKAIDGVRSHDHHYVDQTGGYAIAIGAHAAGIFIADRDNCAIEGPLWLDLPSLRASTIARAKEVLEKTNPEAFPPDPVPRYAWEPKYCSLGAACACAK